MTWKWWSKTQWLTEVEDHAGENDESKPDAEVGDEVDDGDDDVTDGGKDTEQDVAADRNQHRLLLTRKLVLDVGPSRSEATWLCPTSAGCWWTRFLCRRSSARLRCVDPGASAATGRAGGKTNTPEEWTERDRDTSSYETKHTAAIIHSDWKSSVK